MGCRAVEMSLDENVAHWEVAQLKCRANGIFPFCARVDCESEIIFEGHIGTRKNKISTNKANKEGIFKIVTKNDKIYGIVTKIFLSDKKR